MKSRHNNQFSLVIPVFNERENIVSLISEINYVSQSFEYEIMVVDDGSHDGTVEALQVLAAKMSTVRLLRHTHNLGKSVSVIHGVRAASFPWIITLDGDGQNDPADIPLLISALKKNNFDEKILFAGIREKRQDNRLRLLSSAIANAVRIKLLQDDCPDTGCGLKLFSRNCFLSLPLFNHVHRFLPALFKRAGGQVVNVKVSHRPRLHGKSKYGVLNRLWIGVIDLFGVAWLMRRSCENEIKYDT